ncbi:MAG: C1 family peptidase [Candidatus Omnitrophota bacterium]
MKILKKNVFWGLLLAAVMVSVILMSSLQGLNKKDSEDSLCFSSNDTVETVRGKIQKMRDDIARNHGTFEVGITPAVFYPVEKICGANPDLKPADSALHERPELTGISDVMTLPSAYTGYYSMPPADGLNCSISWAFGTTCAVEGAVMRYLGNYSVNFSEQYLLDCNIDGWECTYGGWYAFNMFMSPYGSRFESCYPYTGVKGTCQTACSAGYRISNWYYVGSSSSVPTVDAIKNAIYSRGNVGAGVYVNSYFQAYTSGCFSYNLSGSANHFINLVGWNDSTCTTGGWYLKNDWGTAWGQCGMMWIKYGVQQVGYAAAYAVYP